MAVHARPAAFDGVDGFSYSVDILTDATGDAEAPYGAYLFFVKWGHGEPQVTGHLETGFMVSGVSEAVVRHQVGAMSLNMVKATLDGLIRTAGTPEPPTSDRKWWDVVATESDDEQRDEHNNGGGDNGASGRSSSSTTDRQS